MANYFMRQKNLASGFRLFPLGMTHRSCCVGLVADGGTIVASTQEVATFLL
ncbi:MAG: hypothetical protein H0W50_10975 [Parachlamydiaceae bacterium]|nr:hypothetical protein [Parachlamydiaceae bacterium]